MADDEVAALGREVVQHRHDVQRERQQLLRGEHAVALDEVPERRSLEVLDQQMRVRRLERDVEAADEDGMREPREDLALAFELAQRVLVAPTGRAGGPSRP